jgi:hypothetical protein
MMPQADGMDMNMLGQRLRRLVMLDTTVFEEVRADREATVPALLVAAISTVLAGFGGWLWWVVADLPESGDRFIQSFIIGSIISMILWGVWLGITYVLLTQAFRARADANELLRVMGFAAIPLALSALMFIPVLDFAIGLVSLVLLFGLNVIAVQTTTDAPAGRVLAAVGGGFAVWALVLTILVGDDNTLAPGFFIFDVGKEILKDIGDFTSSFDLQQ